MCESLLFNRWTIYLMILACCWYILIQLRLDRENKRRPAKLYLTIENWGMCLMHAVCITLPILLGDFFAQQYISVRASLYWAFIVPFMFDCLRSVASNVWYLQGQLTRLSVLNTDNFFVTMVMLALLFGFQFFSMLEVLMVLFYCVQKVCFRRTAQHRHYN